MSILETLLSIGPIRKTIWRLWYPFLTKRLQSKDVRFLNYAYESDPALAISLSAEDESDRACIQLYHHVASQVNLEGMEVLEVSCGHGGGASWISRTMNPASYVGLDLNPAGIRFCKERHPDVDGLSFLQGDAQALPFENDSFDAVINVEASHCYPDIPRFLKEVERVLKPGGHFLYADFRFRDEIVAWEKAIEEAPFTIVEKADISAEVLRGMGINSEKSLALVETCLPKILHARGRDFAGVPDSQIYDALESGELSYRSWCFRAPG